MLLTLLEAALTLKNVLVKGYALSRDCLLASLNLADIKLCNVNMEEILQTQQEYGAKLSPISSVLLSCPFFQFAEPFAPFLAL